MLDAVLVEHFHAAHRQRRNGLLTAGGDDAEVRFLFENGNPVAVEFGADKERLLADALLDYHRITPQFHQVLLAAHANGQGAVAEMVLRHQMASEEEVSRTTQSMVEDALCRAFSGSSTQVDFRDGAGTESLDFTRRAFRLRIDSEVLLRTARSRIEEIHAAYHDDHDWSAVYVFAENAASGTLGDYEKRVLDWVDGTRSVTDIAIACRDSCLNMGRGLRALAQKGVVRRAGAVPPSPAVPGSHSSGKLKAVHPPTSQFHAPKAPSAPTTFVPVHHHDDSGGGGFTLMRVVLLATLVVVALVGWLIVDYRKEQNALAEVKTEIDGLVARGAWSDVTSMIELARQRAGNDVSAQRLVDGMQERYQTALTIETTAIRHLIDNEDFAAARARLQPLGSTAPQLLDMLASTEAAQAGRLASLVARIDEALKQDDTRLAQELATSSGRPADQEAASRAIERWRNDCLTAAGQPAAPLAERRARLALALVIPPSPTQRETAARIQADIDRRSQDLATAIARWRERCNAGETLTVAEDIRGMNLGDLLAGEPLLDEANELLHRVETMQREAGEFRAAALSTISSSDPAARAALQQRATALVAPGGNSPAVRLARQCLEILADLDAVSTSGPAQAQADAIRAIATARETDPEFAAALITRSLAVSDHEQIARQLLDEALAIRRNGEPAQARERIVALLAQSDMRGTAAARAADEELVAIDTAIARLKDQREELDKAIASGDVAGAWALARIMGLRHLPLAIESTPPGADVLRDGSVIGTTPMTLDVPSVDRVDLHLEVRLDGYTPVTLDGATAEGGWRLATHLARSPAATGLLPAAVTSRPLATDNGIAVANRQALYLIAADATITVRPFTLAAVDDPIYAPVTQDGNRLLVATRDLMALALPDGGAAAIRLPLAVRTDLPLAIYRSQLIADRELLIAGGLDGVLAATDPTGLLVWSHLGAPLACAPLVCAEGVLALRRDGQAVRLSPDEGEVIVSETLDGPVVAAWVADGRLHAFTETSAWVWDGGIPLATSLPAPIIAGAMDVIVTVPRRILVRSGETWNDVGRLDPAAEVIGTWKGHAITITGRRLVVHGPRGFLVTSTTDLLPPVVLGDQLVVVDQAGHITIYR